MTTAYIRQRLSQIALKVESTVGTDAIAGTPAASDYVTGSFSCRFIQDQTPNPVATGAYDDAVPIAGGLFAEISMEIPIIGSGSAGTAPEWGKLLTAAGMIETTTAAAVGAPTAATAGTATTVTAQTPFGTTAQQYRGMPIILAGNPSTAVTDVVTDYTTGRVITLANTYSPVLSTSTTLQIPINVLYSPTSDESLEKTLTIYAWQDDLRHIVTGARASRLAIALTDARPAMLMMSFVGQVVSRMQAVSRPAGYTPATRQPPLWRAGMSRLARIAAPVASASFDAGLRTARLENPEATQGYDPAILTGRSARVTLDPFSHSTNTPLRAGYQDASTAIPYAAIWGSTAGNRFALSTPSAVVIDLNPGERNEMGVDQIVLAPDLKDAAMFLACF